MDDPLKGLSDIYEYEKAFFHSMNLPCRYLVTSAALKAVENLVESLNAKLSDPFVTYKNAAWLVQYVDGNFRDRSFYRFNKNAKKGVRLSHQFFAEDRWLIYNEVIKAAFEWFKDNEENFDADLCEIKEKIISERKSRC